MTADNPYRTFVDDFRRLLTDTKPLDVGTLVPPTRPPVPAAAPKVLIFAPHPDDEVIIGGLPLRLLRELKMNVVNVAVTLGSRVDRQTERWQELKNCCDYIGFGLLSTGERGLEGINPAARKKDDLVLTAKLEEEKELATAAAAVKEEQVTQATIGQLLLQPGMAMLSSESSEARYKILRPTASGRQELSANELTELSPGDVLQILRKPYTRYLSSQ